METDTTEHKPKKTQSPRPQLGLKQYVHRGAMLILGAAMVIGIFVAYLYTMSPAVIRKPTFQHYHFRMQVIAEGKAVNFGEQKFQVPLGQDACSVDLTKQPIHFHDGKDQMVHIHWDGMTGGLVLKYYGWNKVGGLNNALGYRFDTLPTLKKVPIAGTLLPQTPNDTRLYVYAGDERKHQSRSLDDFLTYDLETFFGKASNLPGDETAGLLDRLFPKAAAHSGTHAEDEPHTPTEELEMINNLIGNVVIFAQKDAPTEQQVTERFNNLAPLSASTCGG